MTVRRVPIRFPFRGQTASVAFTNQPAETSESMLNVRPLDSKAGERVRGAQRSGLVKHILSQVSGANPVVDLGVVVADDSQITYAVLGFTLVEDDWSVDDEVTAYACATDAAGNFYSITGAATWVKYNPQGWKLAEKAVPVLNSSGLVRALAVDSEESVYVAVSTGGTQADARIYKYQLRFDGGYELAYSGAVATELGSSPATVAFVSKLHIKDDVLYVAVSDATNTEAEIQVYQSVNELAALPATSDLSFACDDVPFGLCVNSKDEIIVTHHASPFTSSAGQGVTKYSSLGVQVWQVLDNTGGTWDGANGGLGHACAVAPDDSIYVTGEVDNTSTEWLNHINDDGTFDWSKANGTITISEPWGRTLAVDTNGSVYAPLTAIGDPTIYVYDDTGTQLTKHTATGGTLDGTPRCVAIPPGTPVDAVHEFVFYGLDDVLVSTKTVGRARLVSATIGSGSQRTLKLLAVCNGDIKADVAGVWTAVTGGTAALDTTGEFVGAVTLFGKRYYTDGSAYKVYDLATDTVSTLIATAANGIPQRCKVIGAWRGRLVLARSTGHDWYMSKIGDPANFNFNVIPPVPPDSAVEGVNSDVGAVPDIINCFIPWNDDLAFWGCDHSIWRMTGDPLDGGQIDDVSKTIGIAFGNRSWTRDANGRIYFISTEGDVYQLSPPSGLRNISADSINDPIRRIDLSSNYAVLTWSEEERGLYLHVTGRASFGVTYEHYFWSDVSGGWFPVGYKTHKPRCAATLDGDAPADRTMLIGCEDGIVRRVDPDALDDDDEAINSSVLLGPYGLPSEGRQLRLVKWQVTLSGSDQPVQYEVFASNTADSRGDPVAQGVLYPGKNDISFARARGEFFWIRLFSNAARSRWALETGWMEFATAGRQRP